MEPEGEVGLNWVEGSRDRRVAGVKARRRHNLEWCKLQTVKYIFFKNPNLEADK